METGFVDAATAAILKATKAIAAAETVERKAVAKADVVLAQDLQSAWGTYAAAECGAVILNARERATIGADYKKEIAGAELAAVKAVAPARRSGRGWRRPAPRSPTGLERRHAPYPKQENMGLN